MDHQWENKTKMTTEAQYPLFVERPGEWWEFHGQTFEEHVECWQLVDGQVQKDKWKLSSVAASLNTKYNDKTIARFAHETRRSARRIREYAQTYRAFENGERSPILSFHHHTVAARAEDPVVAIHKAEDGEWSTRELEKWIETGVEPDDAKKEPIKPGPEMQKIHDAAVREELQTRLAAVKEWTEPVDPLLSTVYGRVMEILEWQRDRSLERDCTAIMKIFTGDVGTEAPERVSDDDLAAWLYSRGFIMSKEEIGRAGYPERKIEPSGRLGLMLKLKMLTVETREESRGETQRGVITSVYAAHRLYIGKMEDIAELPATERAAALRKDWAERIERYAPELMPVKEHDTVAA